MEHIKAILDCLWLFDDHSIWVILYYPFAVNYYLGNWVLMDIVGERWCWDHAITVDAMRFFFAFLFNFAFIELTIWYYEGLLALIKRVLVKIFPD